MTMLELQQISRTFGGVTALNGVGFKVAQGSIHGVIGPNGAGKTTLINIISGFDQPDTGKILLQGNDITRTPVYKRVRSGIARTFQIPQPFTGLTMLETIMIPLLQRMPRNKAWLKADEIAGQMLLGAVRDQQAQSQPIGTLKLLELARAVAAQPKLLLIDEPMGGLGTDQMDGMIALLREIRDAGVTIILVEHVMKAVVSLADELTVLNFGQVLARGETSVVLRLPEVIAAYLGTCKADAACCAPADVSLAHERHTYRGDDQ